MAKSGLSALNESGRRAARRYYREVRGSGVMIIDFRPGDYRTDFEGAVRRPEQKARTPILAMMPGRTGPGRLSKK